MKKQSRIGLILAILFLILIIPFTVLGQEDMATQENLEQSDVNQDEGLQMSEVIYTSEDPTTVISYADSYERLCPDLLQFDSVETSIEDRIYAGLMARETSIDLYAYKMQSEDVYAAFHKALARDLYYYNVFPFEKYYCMVYPNSGIVDSLELVYRFTEEEIAQRCQELKNAADAMLDQVAYMTDEWEIVLTLHDELILQTEYDYDNYRDKTIPKDSYYGYGILVNHIGVCNGYALVMNLLLSELGIDSFKVSSNTELNHAWNMIKVDGNWYHLDATWDDPVPDKDYYIRYENFLVNDDGISKSGHGEYDWNAQGITSTSEIYANMPRKNNNSQDYFNGLWYVADGTNLSTYQRDGSTSTVIKSGTRLNGVQEMGNYIYYSTGKKIIKLDTITNNTTEIYTLTTEETGQSGEYASYIYGLCPVSDYVVGYRFWKKDGTKSFGQIDVSLESIKGDVDRNGRLDITDVTFAKQIAMKTAEANALQIAAADFNEDKKITINEVRRVYRSVLSGQPIE